MFFQHPDMPLPGLNNSDFESCRVDEREKERIHHRSDGRSGSEKRKEFGSLFFFRKILVLGLLTYVLLFYIYFLYMCVDIYICILTTLHQHIPFQ